MRKSLIPMAVIAGLAVASWTTTIYADSARAECEVREHGDKKRGQSGPCMFSQRQGYIDIRLNNGKEYSLSPQQGKAGVYKDQEGRRVKRTEAGGNVHKYQWEHRNITVTFDGGSHNGSGHHGGSANASNGDTPRHLQDLVGVRASSGEQELERRGYRFANSQKGGGSIYSNWWENSSGRCITVRTADGRYQSIIYVPEFDCRQ